MVKKRGHVKASEPKHDHDEMSPDSAQYKVLHTNELLEAILLALDMQTLLFSQRVNREWNEMIQTSVALQKKLWFIPDPTFQARQPTTDGRIWRNSFNWFLYDRLKPWFLLDDDKRGKKAKTKDIGGILLHDVHTARSFVSPPEWSNDAKNFFVGSVEFSKNILNGRMPTGSWKKMILHQHPTQLHWDACFGCEPPIFSFPRRRLFCSRYHRRPTRFWEPILLDGPPSMEALLQRATEKREAWKAARKEQPLWQRIRENDTGRLRTGVVADKLRNGIELSLVLACFPLYLVLDGIDLIKTRG